MIGDRKHDIIGANYNELLQLVFYTVMVVKQS